MTLTHDDPIAQGRVRLGLRENLPQFALLVGVNALVGGMIGQERTVLPLLATDEFGLTAFTATLTFIAAFGAIKAVTNFFAGTLSDRFGRKPVLVAGWIIGVPVPLILIWAPSWGWVIAANILLGINQGLAWSTTVIMKIDLVGPARRGLAMGFNEAAGYGAVARRAATRPRAPLLGRPVPEVIVAELALNDFEFGQLLQRRPTEQPCPRCRGALEWRSRQGRDHADARCALCRHRSTRSCTCEPCRADAQAEADRRAAEEARRAPRGSGRSRGGRSCGRRHAASRAARAGARPS